MEAQARRHLSESQRALVAASLPALHGSVYPARSGGAFEVQQLVAGSWKTVLKAQLDAGGTFATRVPTTGTYRVAYGGLNGPSVTIN